MGSIKKTLANFFKKPSGIELVIDENEDYLEVLEKINQESAKGINALREYMTKQTPSLNDELDGLTEIYETMEKKRLERVKRLNDEFIIPMKELILSREARDKKLGEADDAEKIMEKLSKKLDKEKNKPSEKQKTEKIAELQLEYENAKTEYDRKSSEANATIKSFEKEKLDTFRNIIKSITEIEEEYHTSVLSSIDITEKKTGAINVSESKLAQES